MTNVRALLEANGWTLEPTGGGCTAYTKPDDASWYWMMTRLDSPTAPELMTDPVTVGRYRLGGVGIGDVSDYSSLQLWAESHYLINPEAPPEPDRLTTAYDRLSTLIEDPDGENDDIRDAAIDLLDAVRSAQPGLAAAAQMLAALKRVRYFHRTNDTPNSDPWLDVDAAISAALAAPPEPSNPHPDHSCAENALRGNRCGICGAFLVAE